MAKVIRSEKGSNKIYRVFSVDYHYFAGNDMLILNDDHANELLKNKELFEVPEKEWSIQQKNKVKEYRANRLADASKIFPELFQKDNIEEVEEIIEEPKKKRK